MAILATFETSHLYILNQLDEFYQMGYNLIHIQPWQHGLLAKTIMTAMCAMCAIYGTWLHDIAWISDPAYWHAIAEYGPSDRTRRADSEYRGERSQK